MHQVGNDVTADLFGGDFPPAQMLQSTQAAQPQRPAAKSQALMREFHQLRVSETIEERIISILELPG